ncbi:MAG TPA: 2-isopropylmalate synthase [Anaerolineales bacterium]|nr:2-isopropylmalate synthase [Anaerolineales bacterium]
MSTDNYIRIFDTTLRDGEQSPGASLTSSEKLEIARGLAKLGVDVIEAGFPAASADDLEAVRRIAAEVGNSTESTPPIICGLARTVKSDIDAAWEAIQHAEKPRIHTFLATSEIHMKYKLRMDREEVVSKVKEMVAYAASLCDDVEFSPEDAGRSDPEFLYLVLGEAIKAGATTLNIPDTVGYTTPQEFGALITGIMEHTPGISKAIVSVHCHDDLGLATANTLAGLQAGARQAEVTMNGIGERAGNTSLEEIAMALQARKHVYNLETGIDSTQITRMSRTVSNYTGMSVQPNKAIVGANAFAHEAGIHQDGMLKNKETYEIMTPETVGLHKSSLVLGKHSGRHALKVRLSELGYEMSEKKLKRTFKRFKSLADKKKIVTDADLSALAEDQLYRAKEHYRLDGLQVASGTMGLPTATVRMLCPDGELHTHAALGTGPVDAAYKAIDAIVKMPNELLEFHIDAVTEGIDAIGEVTVRLEPKNGSIAKRMSPQSGITLKRTFGGYSAHTDIIVASAKAYIDGLNKLLTASGRFGEAETATVIGETQHELA